MSIEDPTPQLTSTDTETAEELNMFFKSVFTKEDDVDVLNVNYFFRNCTDIDTEEPFSMPYKSATDDVSITNINVKDVFNILVSVNPHKSAGDDGIHPRVLKECAKELSLPLQKIYQKSLKSGTVPTSWKIGTITPLFKDEDRSCAENYRPISITSQVGKVLEKIIRRPIMEHLKTNNLLSPHQHGFCDNRSHTRST